MTWIAIVAMSENRVIGREGAIPWRIKGEQKRFKEFTTGHTVVMGRKTWESLPAKNRPLPDRLNIVLSSSLDLDDFGADPSVHIARSLDELPAPDSARPGKLFIIGGEEIYRQALPLCHEILLTRVFGEFEGDAVFPEFKEQFTKSAILEKHEKYQIERWLRKTAEA